ncbi:hypothetical protein [Aquipuribacter sp. MA13-6]|uniref:hypothetical protein n=1 Tax=unclassified Aquipuribacter TaxID=2635084 RepID=UPI003EE8853B
MKPDTHPAYGLVVLRDNAGGFSLLTRSTLVSTIPVQRFNQRYGRTTPTRKTSEESS